MVISYLIIRLGAQMLRDGVKGEFKFEGAGGPGKASLTSASPGLLFVLLGVALAAYAMFVRQQVNLDIPSNLSAAAAARPAAVAPPAAASEAAPRAAR